jgi:uncharacterized protein YcgI (DUF1989 family)
MLADNLSACPASQGTKDVTIRTTDTNADGRTTNADVSNACDLNYTGGGYCTEQGNFLRYGIRGTRNCGDNLERALAPYGIRRRDMDEGCNFNIFMNVAYEPDGTFEIRLPVCKAGDSMDLEAQTDVLVGMSNCPQERNPCNGFNPTPMKIIVYERGGE